MIEINDLPSVKSIVQDAMRIYTTDEQLAKLIVCETTIRELYASYQEMLDRYIKITTEKDTMHSFDIESELKWINEIIHSLNIKQCELNSTLSFFGNYNGPKSGDIDYEESLKQAQHFMIRWRNVMKTTFDIISKVASGYKSRIDENSAAINK